MFKILKNYFWDFIFSSRIYKALYTKRVYKLDTNNFSLKMFDVFYFKGHSLLDNKIELFGKKYKMKSFNDTDVPRELLVILHKFEWLQNLRILDTEDSLNKALILLEDWLDNYQNYHRLYWRVDILAERLFNLLTCLNFIDKETNVLLKSKLLSNINIQINYLLKSYKKYSYSKKIKVIKTLITISFFIGKEDLLVDAINILKVDIKKNILNDGGHISRNIIFSLNYLEDLLIIFYSLKDKTTIDISFIRESIDKIAVFIRSVRNKEGDLAIFNGSYPFDKKKIDYILSLSNISAEPSLYLRDSGYINFRKDSFEGIFDIGAPKKDYNSLLSFELSMNDFKIITNIPNNLNAFKNNLFVNKCIERFSHSCLILILENGDSLFFYLDENNLKYEKREEDKWEVIKFTYSYNKEISFIYYKTVFFSKNLVTDYILGEDLITFSSGKNKVKKAFLRFHLSPNIKSIQMFKREKNKEKAALVTFNIKENDYILSANDNKIIISKNYFLVSQEDEDSCYTLDIPFILESKIIKNEWYISNTKSI